jgi:hypothetical protein
MRRLIVLFALLAGIVFVPSPASAQCSGTAPAGSVCGNPTGGSAFPTPSTTLNLAGDALFQSGRPWCDVRAKGAVGDNVTDDTAAFNACVTQLTVGGSNHTGGTLYVPPAINGIYCLFSGLNITASFPIEIVGVGNGSPELSTCAHSVNLVSLNNARHALRNLTLAGDNTVNSTHDTIVLGASCTECTIDHVVTVFGRYAVNIAAVDVRIDTVSMGSVLGGAVIYTTGAFSCSACKLDGTYPISTPGQGTSFAAWQSAHSYSSIGTVVSTAGSQAGSTYLIQLKTAGTSGGSAPTLQPLGTDITDGSAVWRLVGLATSAAVQADTGSSTVVIDNRSDLSGPYTYGLYLTGNAQTVSITNSVIDSPYSAGIYQNSSVGGLVVTGTNITNCITTNCQAIYLHSGSDSVVTNSVIFGNPIGINIDGGKNYTLSDNVIFGSSAAAFYINGSPTNISITGNICGLSANWGTDAVCLDLVSAGSDGVTFLGNVTLGATLPVANSSTGSHNNIVAPDAGIVAIGMGTLTQSPGYNIVATQPASISGAQNAIEYDVTSAGSSSQINRALRVQYQAGYTGSSTTVAVSAQNAAAGTGSTLVPAAESNGPIGNIAQSANSLATTAGLNVGMTGLAQGGNTSVGVYGSAQVTKNNATNIGVLGTAYNAGTGTAPEIGGWFSLNQTSIPTVSAALIADNGASSNPVFLARVNGVTKATIDQSGNLSTAGQIISTAGTPTIASGACGTTTNGAVVSGSTNQSGQITIGAAATTTCTISWSATLTVAPNACVFFPMNATAAATGTTVARAGAPTATNVVLTGSALANANYAYLCL